MERVAGAHRELAEGPRLAALESLRVVERARHDLAAHCVLHRLHLLAHGGEGEEARGGGGAEPAARRVAEEWHGGLRRTDGLEEESAAEEKTAQPTSTATAATTGAAAACGQIMCHQSPDRAPLRRSRQKDPVTLPCHPPALQPMD
jgi:hypothetical protein